ncbi:hypothetical protein BKA93DRAFT_882997 [Sparassis latifolia]
MRRTLQSRDFIRTVFECIDELGGVDKPLRRSAAAIEAAIPLSPLSERVIIPPLPERRPQRPTAISVCTATGAAENPFQRGHTRLDVHHGGLVQWAFLRACLTTRRTPREDNMGAPVTPEPSASTGMLPRKCPVSVEGISSAIVEKDVSDALVHGARGVVGSGELLGTFQPLYHDCYSGAEHREWALSSNAAKVDRRRRRMVQIKLFAAMRRHFGGSDCTPASCAHALTPTSTHLTPTPKPGKVTQAAKVTPPS